MINEFCWWWLDKENHPSSLMKDVVERRLGPAWSKDELVAHQSFLIRELVELFRRMRVDAIQPFVYLSNNAGPTSNWFLGNIRDLHPKPVLAVLKNAFAPFGVSIELWDRHFSAGEKRTLRVFVFNDEPHGNKGRLKYGIRSMSGEWLHKAEYSLSVRASGRSMLPLEFHFPQNNGEFRACAELHQAERPVVVSEKTLFVCDRIASASAPGIRIAVFGENELAEFLRSLGADVVIFDPLAPPSPDVVIVSNGELLRDEYQQHLTEISILLESGKTIIIDEPEFGIEMKTIIPIGSGVELPSKMMWTRGDTIHSFLPQMQNIHCGKESPKIISKCSTADMAERSFQSTMSRRAGISTSSHGADLDSESRPCLRCRWARERS
jgi:hypothetical protein